MNEKIEFKDDSLYYLPLGGVGIFGANCYLYRYNKKWIMIDCGLAFNKDLIRYPGIEIMYPDISFIENLKDDLLGIVLTHAHEEHIGAIPTLWKYLDCPIYGSEFTLKIIERKLRYEKKFKTPKEMIKVNPYDKIQLGDFKIDFMPVIHSIPGSYSIKLNVAGKNIIHAGDWRLDNDPVLDLSDEKQWKTAGDEGVTAFVCESTNFGEFSPGQDKELTKPFQKIFSSTKGCVYVAIFASNIARIKVLIQAANKAGRHVGVLGTSLVQNAKIAETCGLLDYEFLTEDDMSVVPKEEMVVILTGSQGQTGSALSRLADDRLNILDLDEDDVVIMSSRAIPGNEADINRVLNKVESYGAQVITADDAYVHVSGHSGPDHIRKMLKWLRPEILIAMHGENDHLQANVDLAQSCGIKNAIVVENGEVYDVFNNSVIAKIETGLVCKNHGKVVPVTSSALTEKKRIIFNGACIVSLILDEDGRSLLREAKITLLGLDENRAESQLEIANYLSSEMKKTEIITEASIKSIIKKKIKEMFNTHKPIIEIHIL